MIEILILIGGFVVSILISEIVLRGNKLQTALSKTLLVQIVSLMVVYFCFLRVHQIGFLPVSIFWIGSFLTWFGLRSHIESSILLRMIDLLRKNSLTKAELVSRYESHYGQEERFEELVRAGLLHNGPEGVTLTPRGKLIHSLACHLR